MWAMLGKSPPLISERAVQNKASGKTIPWVILNWSHAPDGVSSQHSCGRAQQFCPLLSVLAESMLTPGRGKGFRGCDNPLSHPGDIYKLHCPFG